MNEKNNSTQLSVQECINKLKQKHPDLYPIWYIEDKGVYLFNLLQRGINREEAPVNFYAVDPKNGQIAGPIPVMSIYGNPDLGEKIKKPHKCSLEDRQSLNHDYIVGDNYLCHHGIKGQRWGVRRFQNEDGSLTAEGKERYNSGSSEKPGFFEKQRIKQAERGEIALKTLDAPSEHVVDREQSKKGGVDKARIVTEVAYTVINPLNAVNFAVDGIAAGVAKHKLNSYFKDRETKSEIDSASGLYKKKDGSYNEKQDLAAVNPGFMNMNTNTKNNCMLCTTTYDLRKRGYDVTAQLDSEGYTFGDLKRWYPKAEIVKNSRYDENGKAMKQKEYVKNTIDKLIKQGDGARGNLMLSFPMGGGHSLIYEISGGKLILKDGQSNTVYTNSFSLTSTTPPPESIINQSLVSAYARLDNVEPDINRIKKECVR